ncbi:MAG: VWA domain-containing protein, partial [Hyphomicrobiaceae bacterium]
MTRWMRTLAVTVGLALPALSAQAQSTHAQTGTGASTTMIVFDGSNSMNGRLEGDTSQKYVTAVAALKSALAGITPGASVGLAAFGARRQRDCTDAAVLVPPTAAATPVVEMLDTFRPGGYSPVAYALQTAAGALPKGGKSTIVLLLDDLASCRSEDPCVTAEKLKSDNPALTIHVIGLGLKPSEAEVMQCVADKTGGRLFDASEPNAAAQAIADAVKLSLAAPVAKSAPKPIAAVRPRSQKSGAPLPENVLLPGLNLSARLAPGQPRLGENVQWHIWRADAGPPGPALASASQPTFNIQLRPGRCVIEARAGVITRRRTFVIAAADPV